jgi:tellurite resistance protein
MATPGQGASDAAVRASTPDVLLATVMLLREACEETLASYRRVIDRLRDPRLRNGVSESELMFLGERWQEAAYVADIACDLARFGEVTPDERAVLEAALAPVMGERDA